MLQQNARIITPEINGEDYTLKLQVQVSTYVKYVANEDIILDTAGNRYQIYGMTGPMVNGTTILSVHALDNQVLPIANPLFNYSSKIYTPDVVNPEPVVQSLGTLSDVSGYDYQNYEYTASAIWSTSPAAAAANVGDMVIDSAATEFVITYIDPSSRFSVPFRLQERNKIGQSPVAGNATLYRGTPQAKLFQGSNLSAISVFKMNGKSLFYADKTFPPPGGDIGQVLQKASTLNHDVVWGDTTAIMPHDDLSSQIDIDKTIFAVTQGNYVAGSLTVSIGGIINDKNIYYFEEDPATGLIRFAIPPTIDDAPIIAQYQYLP